MSRKNVLLPYELFDDADMSGDLTSAVTTIQWLDNICFQLVWTGNPTGTFDLQGSVNYNANTGVGTWTSVTLSPAIAAAGTADNALLDLNQLSFPFVRIVYTTTGIEDGSITTVADVAGSLNSKYFLLDGADGDNWYIWFNINAAGVDPAIPSRTGVVVAAATGASANTLGGLLRTALASVTSIENIAGANAVATFDQTVAGAGALVDGAAPTGFTFDYDSVTGSLDGFIGGKMI